MPTSPLSSAVQCDPPVGSARIAARRALRGEQRAQPIARPAPDPARGARCAARARPASPRHGEPVERGPRRAAHRALHTRTLRPFEKVAIGRARASSAASWSQSAWILPRVGDEPRFLDRLGLFDPDQPFIGVPIRSATGTWWASSPPARRRCCSMERARFLEMVANLIGQAVRLARSVEAEQPALREERDKLRRRSRAATASTASSGARSACAWCSSRCARSPSGTPRC
jgi:hypothetical protein